MSHFYNPKDFPDLMALVDHWQEIRAEYDSLKEYAYKWPEEINIDGKWEVIPLMFFKKKIDEKYYAPLTRSLCYNIPNICVIGFSILNPGCHIAPHHGYNKKTLRAHLGLYTNDQCGLSVLGEIQQWKEGELIVFDDSVIHEAWNKGTTKRVNLLLDFYK